MCINSLPASGNHGRSNVEQSPPAGIGNLVPSTAPRQSTQGFVAPAAAPVKKTPDISDIIIENGEWKMENGEWKMENDNHSNVVEKMINKITDVKEANNNKTENNSQLSTPNSQFSILNSQFPILNSDLWNSMFNAIFSSVPTIYYPLKDRLPEIENNIIKVTVKNDIQKEHFEAKIREALEYLRTHYDEKIENIVVEVDEQIVTKKIIYDVKDKLQNFKEQNEEFEEFLQILDLKIKD